MSWVLKKIKSDEHNHLHPSCVEGKKGRLSNYTVEVRQLHLNFQKREHRPNGMVKRYLFFSLHFLHSKTITIVSMASI